VTVRAEAAVPTVTPSFTWTALLVSVRPKQWLKNTLVFAAPVAGGVITHGEVFEGALVALLVFILASASGYLLNDVVDQQRDRVHPEKSHRPIAAGIISTPVALFTAAVAAFAAVFAALIADKETLAVIACIYLATTAAYCLGLKRFVALELLLLTSGFVLRPLAGAFSTNVRPSVWFLLVCCAAALTIVSGKRLAESLLLGEHASDHRSVLASYSVTGLRWTRRTATALTLACYAGWAVTRPVAHDKAIALLSLIPLAVALRRFASCNDRGEAGAPEDLLLHDRVMQIAALSWALIFVLGLGRV
jgi:decaprenyl-phosphate phosphoribosyltransferase